MKKFFYTIKKTQYILIFLCISMFSIYITGKYFFENSVIEYINQYQKEQICGNIDFNNVKIISGIPKYEINATTDVLGKQYKITWYEQYMLNYVDKNIEVCDYKYPLVKDLKLEDNMTLLEKHNFSTTMLVLFILSIMSLIILTIFLIIRFFYE